MENNIEYKISSDKLSVTINSKGAELSSVQHKKSGFEFIWQANPAIWNRHAPVLFPIVGKLNQNTIQIDDKSYSMNQHGFARDSNFEMVELYQDTVTMMLVSDSETQKAYPYHFRFMISYKVIENELTIEYSVTNTGEKVMFYSVGAHPAFNLPVKDLSKFKIEFEKPENLERHLLTDGLFNGLTESLGSETKVLDLDNDLFMKDAIVFKNLESNRLRLVQPGTAFKIELEFKDFGYMGIWAKYPNQDFICLEPWAGLADTTGFNKDISQKEGIEQCEAGSTKSFVYSLKFDI